VANHQDSFVRTVKTDLTLSLFYPLVLPLVSGTPAALIHPVHLVGRNLTDRSIDVRITAKGKDATARLP
jgi:hypothetical protein